MSGNRRADPHHDVRFTLRDEPEESWDGQERRKLQEGFAVNNWSSLVSFLSVCLMAIGGISWGLKMESRIDKYSDAQSSMRERFLADIATTQAVLARGMLPVTQAKIESIENRLDKVEDAVDACMRKGKNSSLPVANQSP